MVGKSEWVGDYGLKLCIGTKMKVVIRQEVASDGQDVFEINKLAFGQEDEARLVVALEKSDASVPGLSLVATDNNKLVGHILFTKISIEDDQGHLHPSLALAPMAVLPEWQNKGIGGMLVKAGLRRAKELGFKSVIVLGHEHFYPKFGFVPCSKWNINSPFDVPENVFMGIELATDGLKDVSGIVRYAKEFDQL